MSNQNLNVFGRNISNISTWDMFFKDNNHHQTTNSLTIKLYPQNIRVTSPILPKDLNKSEGIPTDVNFTLINDLLKFSFNYNDEIINGEIRSDGSSKSGNDSVNLLISVNQLKDNIKVTCITNDVKYIVFTFLLKNITDLNTIYWAEIREPLLDNISTTCNVINKNLQKIFNDQNIDLQLELICQTDKLGLNLGELNGIVTANKSYPNGYPKELVGKCDNSQTVANIGVQTLYSFRPKLSKVLKGTGNTLFEQTININSMYNTGLTDCEFYLNILAYCTYRYMLAGLSNDGDFSCKWLYSNNYKKFLRNLELSEFSTAIVIFTEPQNCFDFTKFNKYFKSCEHK